MNISHTKDKLLDAAVPKFRFGIFLENGEMVYETVLIGLNPGMTKDNEMSETKEVTGDTINLDVHVLKKMDLTDSVLMVTSKNPDDVLEMEFADRLRHDLTRMLPGVEIIVFGIPVDISLVPKSPQY